MESLQDFVVAVPSHLGQFLQVSIRRMHIQIIGKFSMLLEILVSWPMWFTIDIYFSKDARFKDLVLITEARLSWIPRFLFWRLGRQ